MCEFFSFVGDGFGNFHAIGWETRKRWIEEQKNESPDSHTVILTLLGVPPRLQDRWDKYEYNPLTKEFLVDYGIGGHDHEAARAWVDRLDFKRIVEPLIIKPIVNPFSLPLRKPSPEDIADLKKWDSAGGSVWNTVWASVRASAGGSVEVSLRASVVASVGNSVGVSMGASVWAYASSFFDIQYEYDFTPATRLWERGLVPSFDGKTWRLHSGKQAKIVYELLSAGEEER
jgi:hypothetical protein